MGQVLNALKTFFLQDESGQGLVEYALLISLVALAVVGAVLAFGGKITTIFTDATGALSPSTTTP